MGNHADYSVGAPELRAKFRGHLADRRNHPLATIDAYDDSILNTGCVVEQVIDTLQASDYPSALLCFSDHRERMYCEGYPRESFGHGHLQPVENELDVPVLLWLSRNYLVQYPELANTARANMHVRTSLKSVFYSFAYLARIDLIRESRGRRFLTKSPE